MVEENYLPRWLHSPEWSRHVDFNKQAPVRREINSLVKYTNQKLTV